MVNLKPIFNFELQNTNKSLKKSLLIQQYFPEIRSVTSEYPCEHDMLPIVTQLLSISTISKMKGL
jgi:hypothetical protein